MSDLYNVSVFFGIFAVCLLLYGTWIFKTGDRNLLPYRAQHSIVDKKDVVRVGRIVAVVALVIGVLVLVGLLLSSE